MHGMALDRMSDVCKLLRMAMESQETAARRLIAAAGGRVTRPRVVALVALLETGRTVSHAELHRCLPTLDRVTLYRALDWLAEHRLAHRVSDADGIHRYGPSLSQDQHRHPHFQCMRCGFTTCLEKTKNASIRLPEGFSLDEVEILVKGLCKSCTRGG
jgi:Fur family ferric uptake transcriptional regulator